MKEQDNKKADSDRLNKLKEFLKTYDSGFKKYGAKQYHDHAKSLRTAVFASDLISTIPRSYGKDIPLNVMPYVERLKKDDK